jgi:heme exporter protein C
MRRLFAPLAIVTGLMFAVSPVLIANAPYESTMGLIQKIFYYHVPSWFAMFTGVFTCGIASIVYLFRNRPEADRLAFAAAEIAVVFGLIGLVTGPLWARKAWGVWWQWDARLTMALLVEMIFIGYLLVRRYGGPGSDKLGAAVAIFGMANVPFVYMSVNIWRTVHPKTSVVPELARTAPGMAGPFWFCVLAFMLLFMLLLTARVELERRRGELDELYLAGDDGEARSSA